MFGLSFVLMMYMMLAVTGFLLLFRKFDYVINVDIKLFNYCISTYFYHSGNYE